MVKKEDENLKDEEFKIIEDDPKVLKKGMIDGIIAAALEVKLQEVQQDIAKELIIQKILDGYKDEELSVSNALSIRLKLDGEGREYLSLFNTSIYRCEDVEFNEYWSQDLSQASYNESGEEVIADVISSHAFKGALQEIIGNGVDEIPDNVEFDEVLELLRTDMSYRFRNSKKHIYPELILWKTVGNYVTDNGVKAEVRIGNDVEFSNVRVEDLNDVCLVFNSVDAATRNDDNDDEEYRIID